MKRGIKVENLSDRNGWNFKRVSKAKGQLTVDEIRRAIIDSGDEGYFAVILKCVDDDLIQYYDDDLPEDAVDVYDADSFMQKSGRSK